MGRDVGVRINHEKRAERRSILEAARTQQRRMAETIMCTYDVNGLGSLGRAELAPMLRDYSQQIFGQASQPSWDDLEFLLRLCGSSGDPLSGGGRIDVKAVMSVCEAW